MKMADVTEDLLDYEEEEEAIQPGATVQAFQDPQAKKSGGDADGRTDNDGGSEVKEAKKGSYVGVHATGFRDFLLKPELLRAIVDCGFEHPSEGRLPGAGVCRGALLISGKKFSRNAFRRRFSAWMCSARPRVGWGRLQYSFWRPFSSWSPVSREIRRL